MKKIMSIIGAAALILSTSCAEREYVPATADRQAITSLTAIFTSGPFVDQEMAKLSIGEDMPERLVIPVPFFYPESSDNETAEYMTKVRVQAELEKNCFLEPALTILDLTKENWFTFTNAQGVQKRICITGERVKSDKCDMISFAIDDPSLVGVIDKANKKISIISGDDLSAATATIQVSPHATVSPDPSQPHNFNDPFKFTVTAHNGTSSQEFTVVKERPATIDKGFNAQSLEQLFNIDPVSNWGMPNYATAIGPSLGVVGGSLVICAGDGTAPIYVNKVTGAKEGTINLGNATPGLITNDEGGHLLIVNKAGGYETINIYRTSSVNDAPVLLHSVANPISLPVARIKCIGNIDTEALITLTCGGIAGVTSSSDIVTMRVIDGAVTEVKAIDFSATGISWGNAPVNINTVVPASLAANNGWFESHYQPSQLHWMFEDGSVPVAIGSDTSGWGLNPNSLDSKMFNNVNYLALFVESHFPHWGMGPQLYLYNVDDPSALGSGSDVTGPSNLVLANNPAWFQSGDAGTASGDVVIAPSADGYSLYIYYYGHNSGVVGGWSADCIAK